MLNIKLNIDQTTALLFQLCNASMNFDMKVRARLTFFWILNPLYRIRKFEIGY